MMDRNRDVVGANCIKDEVGNINVEEEMGSRRCEKDTLRSC